MNTNFVMTTHRNFPLTNGFMDSDKSTKCNKTRSREPYDTGHKILYKSHLFLLTSSGNKSALTWWKCVPIGIPV